jgi:hypothetical protein
MLFDQYSQFSRRRTVVALPSVALTTKASNFTPRVDIGNLRFTTGDLRFAFVRCLKVSGSSSRDHGFSGFQLG